MKFYASVRTTVAEACCERCDETQWKECNNPSCWIAEGEQRVVAWKDYGDFWAWKLEGCGCWCV